MFIGRRKELSILNKLYNSNHFEFAVIYGRRRVGKTALINQFIENKKSMYFIGVESNIKQNLENLSRSIIESVTDIEAENSFLSFQSALEYVFKLSEKERIVFVIDEYPYLARASNSLASTLQLLIDKYKSKSKLMLILCGSSMSYMEDEVLAYKAPLYGRRTAQLKILPFDFEETCIYLKDFSDIDKAIAYGIVGGTPQYLLQIDSNKSIDENIKNIYFNTSSPLFEEPLNLLKQEVRDPSIYNAIITAIATGYSHMSEISSKVGENTNVCSSYLKNLITLGIIKKECPYGEKNTKKSVYSIEDNMYRFWYRFVPNNASMINRGGADLVLNKIKPYISDYMGKVFEEICVQYLWKILLKGESPVEFISLGHWWGNDPIRKCQAEIDIIGEENKNKAVFGECKWTNEKIDQKILETLIERSKLFSYKKIHFFLFSKSGFTKGCVNLSKELGNVTLITFKDIMKGLNIKNT